MARLCRTRQLLGIVFQCGVPEAHHEFSRARAAIEAGIRDKLHFGAQLYISRAAEVLVNEAFGHAREGMPMSRDTWTLWFSAGKPITAAALAHCVSNGLLTWQTLIADLIPEFARHGKDGITLAHVLTHTAGLHALDPIDPALPWEEKLARIYDFALPLDWVPGERAAYSSTAGWYVLGEVYQRVTRQPLDEFVRRNFFQSGDAGLTVPSSELNQVQDSMAWMYDTSGSTSAPVRFWNSDEALASLVPGGSARGVIAAVGKFYERLLFAHSKRDPAINQMIARQRSGVFDETFQFKTDMGYGVILNSNYDGVQMPYGYGRAASRDTFGHSGNQSSCAFADPERQLVVAWACNGMPGERKHQQRQRAINNAIYEDLGIK
jgi:CubicO group peptidase (beta-lactamase class C family)